MVIRAAVTICLTGMLAWAQGSYAAGGGCTTRSSGDITGDTPAGSSMAAGQVFDVPCRGGIRGELQVLSGRFFDVTLQLEQYARDGWRVVQGGQRIAYSAMPGMYRFTVRNSASDNPQAAPAVWRLRYSLPF
ncbi:hypothetical protein [Paracandidimonas lactea]|uniref:hypothetical protein n=1 Tax=Paracandidimonas lactea TaxID=2895524 RepID=UPI001F1E8CAD|nr:hypothetical protein [Paracandidimonas lactea]